MTRTMKHVAPLVCLTFALALPGLGWAETCFADYKAKQDNPLRLHYGVMELRDDCTAAAARSEITRRLQSQGWTLLNVLAVFGPEGLDERKESAGAFFLRY